MKQLFGILLMVAGVLTSVGIIRHFRSLSLTSATGINSENSIRFSGRNHAAPMELLKELHLEGKVRDVRKEGKDLFLISNDILYRYTMQGDFVCRITRPEEIKVAGYVVDQAKRQIIVLGNSDDIYYYSFNGILLEKKKLRKSFTAHNLRSAV